ncbi:MAG: 50S ribosomal protein L10 [Candidatus Thorarchaeota archaeon]
MIGKKEIPQWKSDEVAQLVDLCNQYKTIAIIEVAKLNDKQIQEMRKILRGKAIIRMSKKNLQLRAIEKFKNESKKKNLEELERKIPGQAALCFTNMDIFELKQVFNNNLRMVPAKPDEITPVDIWVPAGDTGLPTGQVISELNMTLRLPTRIQNDTIWVREDTQTHKVGDFVNVKQAAVLKKLGINPIKSLIRIKFAWSDGDIFSEDIIYMDIEELQKDFILAYSSAQKLALEIGIIDDETIKPLMQKAYRESLAVLFELPIYFEELKNEYFARAIANANLLNSMIFGEGIQATLKKEEKQEKGKEAKEEPEEEVGIGSLFG